MSRTESAMVQLGTIAPDFRLTNVSTGEFMTLADVRGTGLKSGLLIMFVCVHCPYVKHVEEELARIGKDYYGESGSGPIAIAAIQSNDIDQYPEDGRSLCATRPPVLVGNFLTFWMFLRKSLGRTKPLAPRISFSSMLKCAWLIVANSIPAARGAKTSATTSL